MKPTTHLSDSSQSPAEPPQDRAADPLPPPQKEGAPGLGAWAWLLPLAWVGLLAEALFGAGVLSQADALLQFEPWAEVRPEGYRASNPLLLDQSLVMQPWLEHFAERLRQGELPLWNPDNYLGQPIHAANTGALFWPPHLLYYLWPGPGTLVFLVLAKLLIGGLGFQRLGLALGARPAAATLGALVLGLSGFQVAWLGHPHTAAACLLPWLLLVIERARRSPGPGACVGFALCVAGLGLSGHLQTALHAGLLAMAWALLRVVFGGSDGRRLGPRGLRDLFLGGLAGLALASPQLLPFLEYLDHSRAQELFDQVEVTAEVDPGVAAQVTYAPESFGDPRHGNYEGPLGANLNFNELIGPWVGRIAWVLALIGLWSGRRRAWTWWCLGFAVLGLAAAWQLPGIYDGLREVPVLRSTKLMRLALWSNVAVALLAMVGAEAVIQRAGRGVGPMLCLAVAFELLGFARGYNPTIDRELFAPATPTIEFLQGDPEVRRIGVTEGTLLFANGNLFHGLPVITGYDSIEDHASADLIGRLSNDPRAEWFVKEIRQFDRPVPLWSALGLTHVLSRAELPPPLREVHRGPTGLRTYRNDQAQAAAFVARSVDLEADAARRLERLGGLDWDPDAALVEQLPVDQSGYAASVPPGRVVELGRAPQKWSIRAELSAPGLLVLTEAHDPGWRVWVDGARAEAVRVNHALRGVWLPPGNHEVLWRYQPRSLRLAWLLAAAAAGALTLGALWPRLR